MPMPTPWDIVMRLEGCDLDRLGGMVPYILKHARLHLERTLDYIFKEEVKHFIWQDRGRPQNRILVVFPDMVTARGSYYNFHN